MLPMLLPDRCSVAPMYGECPRGSGEGQSNKGCAPSPTTGLCRPRGLPLSEVARSRPEGRRNTPLSVSMGYADMDVPAPRGGFSQGLGAVLVPCALL